MAHEAAHVVQQQGAPTIQHYTHGGGDAYEHEAHQASAAVVRGQNFQVQQRTWPRLQRLGVKDALDFFADKANMIPGFRMFTLVIGINPINMSSVPRTAANVCRAVLELIPFGGMISQALDGYWLWLDKAPDAARPALKLPSPISLGGDSPGSAPQSRPVAP